jgi:hypothetical protein
MPSAKPIEGEDTYSAFRRPIGDRRESITRRPKRQGLRRWTRQDHSPVGARPSRAYEPTASMREWNTRNARDHRPTRNTPTDRTSSSSSARRLDRGASWPSVASLFAWRHLETSSRHEEFHSRSTYSLPLNRTASVCPRSTQTPSPCLGEDSPCQPPGPRCTGRTTTGPGSRDPSRRAGRCWRPR